MSKTTENASGANELLHAEQMKKLRALEEMIAEGLDDVRHGRVSEWNYNEFLREARRLEHART